MPVSDIVFQGINRAASDYSNAGACEELINLRPADSGLVPVKPFSVKMANVTYEKVYVHNTSRGKNYIGVSIYNPGISAPCLLFWLLDDAGARIGPSPILV
ncbi:MAG: hypothetical protein IJU69_07245, partial [Bacteroidales bacterium]|nr:hypothetical protein [Bacteroidales bacterium]